MYIRKEDIEDEVMVCPYCMNEISYGQQSCCGESSEHFEIACCVKGNDSYLLKTDVIILKTEETKNDKNKH
ncbi:MAG: hypothetical protein WC917_02880 [Bacilli bacterium]|jgi:hypothetical protein